jgi:hypothetical protein
MEQALSTYSIYVLFLGVIFLLIFAFISLKVKGKTPEGKRILFGAITVSILTPTLILLITTVYLNVMSVSGGPVHWHADFEIWNCGQEISLKDPTGLSNKLGTSTLHEHNDKRIHLEGLVMDKTDASLGNFFHVIGGELSSSKLSVPTNKGELVLQNGANCHGQEAELQAFVYKTDKNGYFSQQKLIEPQSYVISPETNVPPADCVIIEFDTPKDRTEKLCRSYKVAEKIGKIRSTKFEIRNNFQNTNQ